MSQTTLVEIVLYVDDVEAAARFLAGEGLPAIERSQHMTVLAAGPLRLALCPADRAGRGHDGTELSQASLPSAELVLSAARPRAAHDAAVARGARSLVPEAGGSWGRASTVAAPGGLRLTWYSRQPSG